MNEHSIGYIIRHYRQLREIKVSEFALKLGVSQQTVCYWESNFRTPSLSHLMHIADVLNVDVKEFLQYFKKEER